MAFTTDDGGRVFEVPDEGDLDNGDRHGLVREVGPVVDEDTHVVVSEDDDTCVTVFVAAGDPVPLGLVGAPRQPAGQPRHEPRDEPQPRGKMTGSTTATRGTAPVETRERGE